VPPHKSLASTSRRTSACRSATCRRQFFANVYLDALDQFVKHQLRRPPYVRYVDDFVCCTSRRSG
jgi:RNA-directed DNA polymerase